MIASGNFPNSLEALVLMTKHKAGAELEIKLCAEQDWAARCRTRSGKPFVKEVLYRLAENQNDS